ncbi:hypothetical protein [Phenylobacterium sp.]|uniref:DUF6968 family protein n=1 Tax=Phenylobacterium sp. TaxID=1871053 RepID=UPI00301C6C49
MTVIAELSLDLAGTTQKVTVRLFAPEELKDGPGWRCRYEIGEPISHDQDIYGEWSLQALMLALKGLSSDLYGSDEYKEGRLGIEGQFGGYLGIPAPNVFLNQAPYPF